MTAPLLALEQCDVAYGTVEAVREATLSVADNEIVTVIGANGAGKTTLLNAVMGVLPSCGAMRFADRDIHRLDVEARVERGMCLVPEKRELFGSMSVEDNLVLGGFRVSAEKRRAGLEQVFARFPRLFERRRQLAATLSGGEQQMLAIGRALMARPRLLMLDEPSLGLAPLIVAEIFRIMQELRRTGVSILLVEQNARAALRIADRAYVMELGVFTMRGPASEFAGDERIVSSYLKG
ncbi:MAG: ABC transporter ATP-binding protein [Xanthobacteraceae bacterium]